MAGAMRQPDMGARTARRQHTTTVADPAWSIAALVRRFGLASRRPALV